MSARIASPSGIEDCVPLPRSPAHFARPLLSAKIIPQPAHDGIAAAADMIHFHPVLITPIGKRRIGQRLDSTTARIANTHVRQYASKNFRNEMIFPATVS